MAQREGAAMVMLMAPFFGATFRVDEDTVVEYFKRHRRGRDRRHIGDAPMSPTPLSGVLLARLANEIPQVEYVKVEMPQTADKLRALAPAAGASLPFSTAWKQSRSSRTWKLARREP
ncbi:Dihydrodipicolinate synthetase family [Sinomonas atrocyanea]|uniref:Dihydrodipicolinate synthetase family n=1 Tax=Sinomonas atrocyanea TaxID=37927 RepID=A0A126ZYL4_9MICC|nr:hypothetical protein [Sinomonas atrocyanea]AMM31654.1 Dihydrodipicolinate synthetase family [Sinomonas atrocyanea]GEB64194.1 hypothetical protein SAT01_16420 [Sinomonas atrocyanea]GGG57116.1 hypothetical protein GCM10007172_05010 [Sinomonas atrocyanea]